MQLTRFSDFALRVLMYVHAADGRVVTIAEIATSYRISRAHLMKVVNVLTRDGYLTAVRGRAGGVVLAKPAHEISLGHVVRSTELNFALVECLGAANTCVIDGHCGLKAILRRAMAAFLTELDRHTLASAALRPKVFKFISEATLAVPPPARRQLERSRPRSRT